jgi:hypothetical protein
MAHVQLYPIAPKERSLELLDIPVIAAINGFAWGVDAN